MKAFAVQMSQMRLGQASWRLLVLCADPPKAATGVCSVIEAWAGQGSLTFRIGVLVTGKQGQSGRNSEAHLAGDETPRMVLSLWFQTPPTHKRHRSSSGTLGLHCTSQCNLGLRMGHDVTVPARAISLTAGIARNKLQNSKKHLTVTVTVNVIASWLLF